MAIGLIGTIIPILPGTTLLWITGLTWVILDGGGWARWIIFAIMTALFIISHVATIRIPTKRVNKMEPSKGSVIVACLTGIVGFFVIPVVGLPLGFIFGIFIWNLINTREFHRALRITWKTTQSFGVVTLVQMLCGIGIALLWLIGLVLV